MSTSTSMTSNTGPASFQLTPDVYSPLALQGSASPSASGTIPTLDSGERQELIQQRFREALARANFAFREPG